MSSNQDQAGVTRRRGRRDPRRDCAAMSSHRYVRLLISTGQAMADRAVQPLTGSPRGRLGLGSVRGVRGAKHRGHDFNDPVLYARMHRECRRIYTRAFGAISDADWDPAFNFACGQAWSTERKKGPIDQLAAWLTTAAHNAVVSEYRKTARVDLLADEEALTEQAIADLAETVEDRQMLRDAISCLKTSLPERVRLVWTMRFAGDYEPDEIQRRLKISKKAYEKDLEHASRLIVSRLESARTSGICSTPDMASMVRAYAIWGEQDGAERAKLAHEHLEQCPACRQTIRALRAARRAAAFLPPPLLPFAVSHQPPLAVISRTVDMIAGRIQDGLTQIVGRAQDGLLRIKQYLASLITRAPANGATSPERTATVLGAGGTSGALATKAVVGCLAAGVLVVGGGGACLKAAGVGVPSLSGLISAVTGSKSHRSHPRIPPQRAWAASAQRLTSTLPVTTSLQYSLTRPASATQGTTAPSHGRVPQHRVTNETAARAEFPEEHPGTHPVQQSAASESAARKDFSGNSPVAHTSTRTESTPAPTSTAALHSAKSSTTQAESEFDGP